MKQTYLLVLMALLGLGSHSAQAQYEFKDVAGTGTNGLGPYSQNFDLPTAATAVGFNSDGSSKNYPGVYARFSVDGDPAGGEYVAGFNYTATPSSIPANDGGTTNTAWYHFGATGSTERALGGIGGAVVTSQATFPSGVGYIGARLKNSSTVTIKNLEIKYAMEQWYNSSILQAASVQVHYQRTVRSGAGPTYTYSPATLTTLKTGNWTEIPALKVEAPSTTTPIEERNGNSATNRRVAQTTLAGINLLPGEEIMIRFNYVFNASSNGNGLSIDDLVITPETNVFYSNTTGDLDNLNTWTVGADGSGAKPANFTNPNQIFYVRGTSGTTNRVQQGNGWVVTGANSKVIVGIPSSPAIGNVAAKAAVPAALYIDAGNKTIVAPIDVAEGSTLRIDKVGTALNLGYLAPSSTVEYNNTTGTHTLLAASYGNLTLSGTGAKTLGSDLVVSGNLNLSGVSKLALGSYDLTLLRPATNVSTYAGSVQNVTAAAYIVTSGAGRLRQSVPNNNVDIVFPVGSVSSYTPLKLKQSAANSEDVYGVRVIDETYLQYTSAEAGSGTPVAFQNVKKTWLVDEEVDGSSNATMTLQWNKADATTDFVAAQAHINHFVNGRWDRYTSTQPTTTVATDVFAVQRAGITSFSPFAISSRGNGVLPVELTAFKAQRNGQTVVCAWTTAGEQNSAQFVVERSRDGEGFKALGTVPAQGNSTQSHAYRFIDQQPVSATAYYRLRQQDQDGRETFSPVVVVAGCSDCISTAGFSIVPNPGVGQFELWTNLTESTALRATVLNVVGTPVATQNLRVEAGTQRIPLDLTTQPAGIYMVRIETASGPVTLRVVKQ